MRITALQPQATNPERLNVFVDGQFLLGVNRLTVLEMGLKVEQELSEEQLAQLRQEETLQQAVERALNFLSYRPRSREEVRRYLYQKKTPSELIEVVLERLDRLELVNDHTFASFWIESREQFSPRGAQALRHELRQKGVGRDVVEELVDADQDEERALRAGRKKAMTLARQADIDFPTFRTRLGSFLQRRGFGYQVASKTVRALWQELKSEDGEDQTLE